MAVGFITRLLLGGALLVAAVSVAREETDKDWWSFNPATRPEVPEPTKANWARNGIDRFILAKLAEQHLTPSPEADRRTLIRRLTFNLIGLPPSPDEVGAFVRDPAPDAYEKLVDCLLASPRYGERWARHWLDTVHYGETHGYDKDKPRLNAWPYRDYVIRSFNSEKSYARFVEEQLAGDVLFPGEPDGIVALGFIAAGPWDFVGHVELPESKMDGLIARYNDRDDMVMNTMSTFQSLTVHCARCHDHKFDPITTREYYELQAVFAGVDRADRPFDPDPKIAARRRELEQRLEPLRDERRVLETEMARLGGDSLRELDRRIAAAQAKTPGAFGYHSKIESTPDVLKWVQVDLGAAREIDRIVFAGCHDDFNNIGAGFGFPPRYRIEISDDPEFKSGTMVALDRTGEDAPNPGVQPQEIRVGATARYVRFTATKLAPRQNDYIFALAELAVLNAAGGNMAFGAEVQALDSIEAPVRWRKKNLVDGQHFGGRSEELRASAVADLEKERDAFLARVLPESFRDQLASNAVAMAAAEKERAALPKPQQVYAATSDFAPNGSFKPARRPRTVHLLRRGDVRRAVEEVQPGALAAVPAGKPDFSATTEQDEGARRAALAKWITHTNNLLTRRSIVNRVWQYHFGRGLVDTPNDFGRMGGLPSHPELLDWLAFWFLDHGESLKQLHRLIVTSATYRQVSGFPPSGKAELPLRQAARQRRPTGEQETERFQRANAVDAQNRFLWRMNRTRLDAEQIHDAILAISGKLDLTMGGPSVQQFYFKDDHSPVYDYARYDPDSPGAYRRSIYRFITRSVPDPFMESLDCPDANLLVPTRNVTTTALQALSMLNDPFVLRQCEHLAARLVRERRTLPEQIDRAWELALQRPHTAEERARLVAHAGKHGLASACRILFNSNEFMFLD